MNGIQTQEGYSHLILNNLGFHDINVQREKDIGTFRVVVLGDSLTMATQVEVSETYVSRSGGALTSCPALQGKHVEALNFGVGGYTTSQKYLLMRDFIWGYSPDFVVLQEAPGIPESEINAEQDVSAHVTIDNNGHENVDSSFMNSKTYQMRSSIEFTWFLRVSDHSRLLQYINEFRRKLTARMRPKAYKGEAAGVPTKNSSEEKARLLKAISKIAKSHSTPLVLLLIPDGEAIDPRNASAPMKSEDEIWWDKQSLDLAIPIINPATSAWNFARQSRLFLSGFGKQSGVGHLTRYGNDFIGQELANEICGLLSR